MKTATQDIYLTKEQFNKDLEICLTILKEGNGYYLCEYTSAALYKKVVKIFIK